jgi:hypothetical protein
MIRLRNTALGLMAFGLLAAFAWATDLKHGTISGIEDAKIVVTMRAEQMSFAVSPATQISLDGKPAKMTDLKIGDSATVAYVPLDDNSPMAMRIDAARPHSPGNPDPIPQD